MNQFLSKIDDFLEKIPADVKDLIQKAAIALGAILALASVLSAIVKGVNDAKPGGFQIAKESNDLFYLDQIREENDKRIELIEDVEFDIESLTESGFQDKKFYHQMSRNTLDHLRGESDELTLPTNTLRSQRDVPALINEEDSPALKRPENPNRQEAMSSGKRMTDPIFRLDSQIMKKETIRNKTPERKRNKAPITKDKQTDLTFLE